MTTIQKNPEIPDDALTPLVKQLLDVIDLLQNEFAQLKEENQQLKDEIAILKGQKPRPKISPSILEGPKGKEKEKKPRVSRGKHPTWIPEHS